MRGFAFFRELTERYRPRTARSAERAVQQGYLPEEAWLHLAASVKPLDEEPFDLEALDRVLAREDLDAASCRILLGIFQRLTRRDDPEVALLGAESINQLENRYLRSIERLRREADGARTASSQRALRVLRELSRQLYELALLSPSALRNFYLREAYGCLQRIGRQQRLGREEVTLALQVLLELRLHAQAARLFARLDPAHRAPFLLLAAEAEFRRRNFPALRRLLEELRRRPGGLDEETRQLTEHWLGA